MRGDHPGKSRSIAGSRRTTSTASGSPTGVWGKVTWCVVRGACCVFAEQENMTYDEWLAGVPREFTDDPLWRMEVYRLAFFMQDLAWPDVTKLIHDKRTIALADQLQRAVGSISANIAEGYSRISGRDQARHYEYALGSAREARNWYWSARHILTETVSLHRIRLLTQTLRLLLTIIPEERGTQFREDAVEYNVPDDNNLEALLGQVPLPP